ncbi:Mitochondrial inner membrane protease atp23 [Coemansia sp. RSA 2706]|nr:Mitochondrial inner membrane protease atp23 [Coemansia sp. RSA 2711]KAJ2305506.1 Mitochondrial inner membrane protease atp23 [Coemansia sp. RSA 2706]KAJ2310411.1 Mitochondrial inner membrane protease atp23 [Coemansia sp. RSA 2705]KAJ2317955.1 Mitochondrial inner membrane protease atp23 [Coemansia sp. RSA 2704]KAJ2327177.1 Mitochondrial inner membrane protease atp23 [Coemansia sp. RSA 2702]KAJ2361159.1 Mitochondrial inner membrane protease atp23 [Coemansia sp. RSA 2610]KAJ2375731.1 Mitochon
MADKKDEYRKQYEALGSEDRGLFDFWLRKFKNTTGLLLTPDEQTRRQQAKEQAQDKKACDYCEKWRNELFKTSPLVTFMAEHLRNVGFAATAENMPCMKCDEMRSGGFSPGDNTIQLCYNRLFGKGHLETTMAHEMIHAYDQQSFNIDWYNLEHHACTEIRAGSLSGDCTWFQELMRGHVGFLKHHQVCVKRRAVLSLLANPSCKSKRHAEAAVNKVFDSCFTDTRPFDEIY